MGLLQDIGHFFADLFSKFERAYHSLSAEEQLAAKQASGIIAVINQNLTATPDVIWGEIEKAFPGVDKASVSAALASVANTINNVSAYLPDNLENAIKAVQSYLSTFTGNKWVVISKSLVALIANELAPGSIIQKIELIIEWVYQTFIKGKV